MQNYPRVVIKTEEGEIIIHPAKLMNISSYNFLPRSNGKLKGKVIFLPEIIYDERVEWTIARDESGDLCAIPLKEE